MREVEVKSKIQNVEEIKKRFLDHGCVFSEPLSQRDRVFIPESITFPPPSGTTVLRIRDENGICVFTLKIPQKNLQDCIEREMIIENAEMMAKIIELLGFKEKAPVVDKIRTKTKIGDIEICIDEVKNLGSFIEAEKIILDDTPVEIIQEELLNFLESFGISRNDQIKQGKYDIMLYEKMKNIQA